MVNQRGNSSPDSHEDPRVLELIETPESQQNEEHEGVDPAVEKSLLESFLAFDEQMLHHFGENEETGSD